jgi:hypothetical protein
MSKPVFTSSEARLFLYSCDIWAESSSRGVLRFETASRPYSSTSHQLTVSVYKGCRCTLYRTISGQFSHSIRVRRFIHKSCQLVNIQTYYLFVSNR